MILGALGHLLGPGTVGGQGVSSGRGLSGPGLWA